MDDVRITGGESLAAAEPVPPRRSRRRILVWTVGIIVVGVMVISVFLPSLCRAREPANRVKCASNLRQIGQAIMLYAQHNGGHYPPSLATLLATEDITAEVMICPSGNDEKSTAADTAGVVADITAAETNSPGHKHCLSYIYTGQALNSKTAPSSAIVAYEPLDNHDREGTNVLFGDGHVQWLGKKEWPNSAASAGVPVVLSLTTRPAH